MNKTILLYQNWTVQEEGQSESYPASVPGTVHTDLLNAGLIPKPFYRNNEADLQWIDKQNWIYSCTFDVKQKDFNANQIYLKFNGLDTYAEVWLNNTKILETNNMFRTWEANIKPYLTAKNNTLKILFHSPINKGLELLEMQGFSLPAVNDQSENGDLGEKKVSIFTRKAPYHYGWDWGPRFVTSGIWRPVELVFTNRAEIKNVYFLQNDVDQNIARITAKIKTTILEQGQYKIEIINSDSGELLAKKKITFNNKTNKTDISFSIDKPRLWWPNGYGKQELYNLSTRITNNGHVIDEKNTKIGIRKIELIRKSDSKGKSFYFSVNNVPIFAKGANYIPNDNFLSRTSPEKYEHIVKSAADANMNMLRVWGGGIYENDIFYQLCDKYGLMVWQDFMFACSMYPGSKEFLDNITHEATENIIRLRNHPSMALWCGNNEIDVAWCENNEDCGWGWKEKYSPEIRNKIWHDYDTVFHHILPNLIAEFDEKRDYWPSSPLSDWGETASFSSTSGDMHYWGVWHGNEPFERFYEVKSRFMSEYGFQSFPEFSSVKEFTIPQDWNIYSEVMLSHQRSPVGNEKIKEYMEKYFPTPDGFENQLYIGQALQAYGIKIAIDAHRINKPYTMGTLYWQLNDCWPGASWSGIDYFGRWKALHYRAKEAYKPTALAFRLNNNSVMIYGLNDNPEYSNARLTVKKITFIGEENQIVEKEVSLDYNASTLLSSIPLNNIVHEKSKSNTFLLAELYSGNYLTDRKLFFFEKPKDLHLTPVNLKTELVKINSEKYLLKVTTDMLAKDLAIFIPDKTIQLSDNYFDLLPGETKEITIHNLSSESLSNSDIEIKTLNTFIESTNNTVTNEAN